MRYLSALVAASFLVACATPEPRPELTQAEWASIGTLAIVPSPEPTEVTLWALSAKKGAEVGVMRAIQVANMLTMGLWPLAFYGAGAVCVPLLGASVGALVGAIRKPKDEELGRVQQILFDVITPACLPQVIQDDLLEAGVAHANMRTLIRLDAIEGRPARDRLVSLRDRGIDAVLEFEIDTIEVSGAWGTNPQGALRFLVRYELIATRDGTALFEGTHLEGVDADMIEGWWLEPTEDEPDPTEPLRLQLHEAAKASALAIAEEIFLLHPWVGPKEDPSEASAE